MVLFFSLFSTFDIAYSYNIQQDNIIGDGYSLYHFTETMNQTSNLIPVGAVLKENDTYYQTYIYTIYVEENVDYTVYINDIFSKDSTISKNDLTDVFNMDIDIEQMGNIISYSSLLDQTTVVKELRITLTISMNNIQNYDYDLLTKNDISFILTIHISK
jgi:hypothetical protein